MVPLIGPHENHHGNTICAGRPTFGPAAAAPPAANVISDVNLQDCCKMLQMGVSENGVYMGIPLNGYLNREHDYIIIQWISGYTIFRQIMTNPCGCRN